MNHFSKYNIPEHTTPQSGLVTPEGGHFYYGDYSEGFLFPADKVVPHRHPYFEVFWFPKPSGSFLADFRTFPLTGPCLIFISPGQIHGWPGGHKLKGHMIAFDEAFINEGDKALLRSPLFYEAEASPVISTSKNRKEIAALWKQLSDEFNSTLPDQTEALRSLLRLLIIAAHRLASEARSEGLPHPSSARIYQNFIKLLNGDIPEQHLPKHYAQRLQVSPDYLSECIRKSSGHSAGELIRKRITLESKRLLAHSGLTISEIAYHLHFKDPSYFSRFFKKNTGVLPKTFRDSS